jgi:hypothetical protein
MPDGIRADLFAPAPCLLPHSAQAAVKPAELAPVIEADVPYGKGTLYRLFIPASDAALRTDAKSWSMAAPFALSLQYRMGFSD